MKLKKIIKYILIILSLVAVLFITKILISFISEKNDIPNNYIIENNTIGTTINFNKFRKIVPNGLI